MDTLDWVVVRAVAIGIICGAVAGHSRGRIERAVQRAMMYVGVTAAVAGMASRYSPSLLTRLGIVVVALAATAATDALWTLSRRRLKERTRRKEQETT